MSRDITFFDVETPNRSNSKICSIGVVRTNNRGRTLYERHFLVNPEQGFDTRNIEIHGIKPSMVMEEPTFSELWQLELSAVFDDAILVAHNASFDLNVLEKTLGAYGFDEPEFPYVCTLRSARHALPDLQDYKLPTLSRLYGVPLPQHHNALYDAKACEGVFWGLYREFGREALLLDTFIPKSSFAPAYTAKNRSKMMTELYGISVGISLDGAIARDELGALGKWAEECKPYSDDPIIKSAQNLIHGVLARNAMSGQEHDFLINLSRPFVTDGTRLEIWCRRPGGRRPHGRGRPLES